MKRAIKLYDFNVSEISKVKTLEKTVTYPREREATSKASLSCKL